MLFSKITDHLVDNPSKGLPEDVFLFISKVTPLVCVDLLIKNKKNHTLLTWREDEHYGPGWHIPGGIVRYKETMSYRLKSVAANELHANISFIKEPVAINECIDNSKQVRGHFISFLYKCSLLTPLSDDCMYRRGRPKPNEWSWHKECPRNLISVHEMYRRYI